MAAYYLNKFKGNNENSGYFIPAYTNNTDKSLKIRLYVHNNTSSSYSSPIYVNQTVNEYLRLDAGTIIGSAYIGNLDLSAGEIKEVKDILLPVNTGLFLYGVPTDITIEVFGEDV